MRMTCRGVSSTLAALASGRWTVRVGSHGQWSEALRVPLAGARGARDTWSALCRQKVDASLGVRARTRSSWPRELMSSFVKTFCR
jgi:hypothetical protein